MPKGHGEVTGKVDFRSFMDWRPHSYCVGLVKGA